MILGQKSKRFAIKCSYFIAHWELVYEESIGRMAFSDGRFITGDVPVSFEKQRIVSLS